MRSRPDSTTPFASSSTKSGTPSERAAMAIDAAPRAALRDSEIAVGRRPAPCLPALETTQRDRQHVMSRPGQGGSKSGRCVSSSSTTRRRALRDQEPQPLERRRVGPVQVLRQQHHRLLLAQRQQPREQRLQRLLPLQLGADLERRVALWQPQREQARKQRHRLCEHPGPRGRAPAPAARASASGSVLLLGSPSAPSSISITG